MTEQTEKGQPSALAGGKQHFVETEMNRRSSQGDYDYSSESNKAGVQ